MELDVNVRVRGNYTASQIDAGEFDRENSAVRLGYSDGSNVL